MEHSFDVNLAKKYGVNAAIVIKNFQFWILKNREKGRNNYDGRTWTYNTIRGFAKSFPYWTDRQIRRIIESSIDKGVLVKGNYNKTRFDRTCWYAFANEKAFLDSVTSTLPNSQMDATESSDRNGQTDGPIPDTIPDTETDTPGGRKYQNQPGVKNADTVRAQQQELFGRFWSAYPRKRSPKAARTAWNKIRPRPTESFTQGLIDALTSQKKSDDWIRENGRYIPYPAKWLQDERWSDVIYPEHNAKCELGCHETGTQPATDEDIEQLTANGIFDEVMNFEPETRKE